MFAGVVVALYAWKRYGTPTGNRSSTTRVQFYSTCCAYVLCALTIYLALTSMLEHPDAISSSSFRHPGPEGSDRPFLAFRGGAIPDDLAAVNPVPVRHRQRAAQVLPAIWARSRSKSGGCGTTSRRWDTRRTQRSEALVRDYLNAYPKALANRLIFGRGKTIQHDFTRILCLYCELKELDDQSGFLGDFVDEEEELKKLMELVCAQATSYFSFAHAKDVAPDALEDATLGFEKVCDAADNKICFLFARGLLSASWSGNRLRQRLGNLGFSVGEQPPFILNTVLTAGIIVFMIFASGMFLMRAVGHEVSINRQVTLSIVIAVNYGIAATLALMLKRRCTFGKRTRERGRSVLAYLVSAALTGMAAMSVGVLHTSFWEGGIAAGLQRYFTVAYPWLCPPIVVALLLAFLCDNFALEKSEPRWLRWAEGAITGVAVAAATLGASIWFGQLIAQASKPTTGVSNIASPAVYTAILISIGIAIGLTLGTLVPFAYRKARRVEDSPSPALPAPPLLQAVVVNG